MEVRFYTLLFCFQLCHDPLDYLLIIGCLAFVVSFVLGFSLTHVDEVIDELLTMDHSGDIALPRIRKRWLFPFPCGYFDLIA